MEKTTEDTYKLIKEIISEHNEVWKDISSNLKNYSYPKGYYCFTLPDEQIITIASGLVRKGLINNK